MRPDSSSALLAAHYFLRLGSPAGRSFRHIGLGRANAQLLAQRGVDLGVDVLVLLEEAASILAALANALATKAVPSAALLHDVVRCCQVQHIALAADALAVENVEL